MFCLVEHGNYNYLMSALLHLQQQITHISLFTLSMSNDFGELLGFDISILLRYMSSSSWLTKHTVQVYRLFGDNRVFYT